MKTWFSGFLFSLACCWLVSAAPVSRVFSAGSYSEESLRKALEPVMGPEGKITYLAAERKIVLRDEPEYLQAAVAVLAELQAADSQQGLPPQPNVRVEVNFQETGSSSERGLDVNGRVNSQGDGKIHIRPVDRSITGSSMSNQFLVTQGGQEAAIRVAQDVPFVDYFYQYALGRGYITPATRWESIGSQLGILPVVNGNRITVTVTPQISALVGGRSQIVSYRELATTVTVADGQLLDLGGLNGASSDFVRNFFSGSRRSGGYTGAFSLRATILK
jgi:type II secretory pathway component GspD/PulD (secretin)